MIVNETLKVSTSSMAVLPAIGGPIGTASATVDMFSSVVVTQTVAMTTTATLPTPTDATAGDRFMIGSASTSTSDLLINGITLSPGEYGEFVWSGVAWLSDNGRRNAGNLVVAAGGIPAGNSLVTHNQNLPIGKFSWIAVQASNSLGNTVTLRRNSVADTANAIGITASSAVAGPITFYFTPLA